MIAYTYDIISKRYSGETSCQIDPIESKNQGKEVYLLPANSTWKEPLPEKDGFYVVFNGNDWEYQEKPKPTHNDLILMQIAELKGKLNMHDYWGQKFIDGEYTDEEWEIKKEQRKQWRIEIRELEKQIEPTVENSSADSV